MTVLHPRDITASSPVGAKARALASAEAAGMRVPEWFAVPALGGMAGDGTLDHALDELHDTTFAVRSSAHEEDGHRHSFAGQLETVLDVARHDVVKAIARVRASGLSDRVSAYRRQVSGMTSTSHDELLVPGVIVQRMIKADVSGVAFSADPVTAQRSIVVVTAVHGHSARLVSGDANADTWRIDRNGRIVDRSITSAPPSLSDNQIQAIAALARRAHAHFNAPQDVEWAVEAGVLWLLQSRPVTSLSSLPDPDGRPILWDNSNIVESYGGVTRPLTFSFAADVYEHVYRQFCRVMRVSPARIDASDDAFRNMLGLIRGRMYYNLGNWYRVLALLPGFTINRPFMEQMMGVQESASWNIPAEEHPRVSLVRDALHLLRTSAALVWRHLTINRSIRAFRRRLDATLAEERMPLADMRPDELVAHYRRLRAQLLLSWDAPIVNDFLAMIWHGLLRSMTRSWCNDSTGALHGELLARQMRVVSAEPAGRLQRLAALARPDPTFTAVLLRGTRAEAATAIDRRPAFAAEYGTYLRRFGERTINELKLETLTLHDDPTPLLRAIGRLAEGSTAHAVPADSSSEPDARHVIARLLGRRPVRRVLLEAVARCAQARVRDRELMRLDRTRLFGRVRRTFASLGRALHADGLLDDPRDVFYLTVDEALGFVEGRSVCTSLRDLVAIRRREFDNYERQAAPGARFVTRGLVYSNAHMTPPAATASASNDMRAGLGCSRGLVRGRVKVVLNPETVTFDEPSVLVATHTDPGWILLFPSALAVVVERGSLLSHTAIVARELRIPAIVSAAGVTQWLSDGDWVEVDGGTGIVRKLNRE